MSISFFGNLKLELKRVVQKGQPHFISKDVHFVFGKTISVEPYTYYVAPHFKHTASLYYEMSKTLKTMYFP